MKIEKAREIFGHSYTAITDTLLSGDADTDINLERFDAEYPQIYERLGAGKATPQEAFADPLTSVDFHADMLKYKIYDMKEGISNTMGALSRVFWRAVQAHGGDKWMPEGVKDRLARVTRCQKSIDFAEKTIREKPMLVRPLAEKDLKIVQPYAAGTKIYGISERGYDPDEGTYRMFEITESTIAKTGVEKDGMFYKPFYTLASGAKVSDDDIYSEVTAKASYVLDRGVAEQMLARRTAENDALVQQRAWHAGRVAAHLQNAPDDKRVYAEPLAPGTKIYAVQGRGYDRDDGLFDRYEVIEHVIESAAIEPDGMFYKSVYKITGSSYPVDDSSIRSEPTADAYYVLDRDAAEKLAASRMADSDAQRRHYAEYGPRVAAGNAPVPAGP